MMSRTAQIIHALRMQHKLTQQKMADAVGVSRLTMSTMENGHTLPSPATALSIEQKLGYSARELLLAGVDDQLDQHRTKLGVA